MTCLPGIDSVELCLQRYRLMPDHTMQSVGVFTTPLTGVFDKHNLRTNNDATQL